jgi:hypothetical protein
MGDLSGARTWRAMITLLTAKLKGFARLVLVAAAV